MSSSLLERLKTTAFHEAIGVMLPPPALRHVLKDSRDGRKVSAALRRGEITEGQLEEFVESVVRDFVKGQKLPHDLALAALAAALESHPSDFAAAFLRNLAGLHLAE